MKALSIRQPWAWAILHGGKDVENRSWPSKYVGGVLIHAGKTLEFDPLAEADPDEPWPRYREEDAPRGAIVGYVRMTGCVPATECDSDWASCWEGGPSFCFALEDPVPLRTPVPMPGRLGFFDLPYELTVDVANAFLGVGRADIGADVYEAETKRIRALRELGGAKS